MKKQKKSLEKGITLIALIITIIVLLILAGVSIGLLVGNNGILGRTQNASSTWSEAEANEKQEMKNFEDFYDEIENNLGADESNKEIGDIKGNETENIETKDNNENKIVIPAGFKVLNPEDDVTKGIIIEDVMAGDVTSKGNQYVWIPITHVNGEKINVVKDEEGNERTIELARYEFDRVTGEIKTQIIDGSAIYSSQYTNGKEETKEEHKSNNVIAKDINEFKESVKFYGGYYIARYEAGDPVSTQSRERESNKDVIPVFQDNKIIYNFITQADAARLVGNLYSNQNNNYVSDLVNSYAHDSALIFIQNCSKDTKYSTQKYLQGDVVNTGQSTDGTNKDVRCNIYDLAANVEEWSTETNTATSSPCQSYGSYNGYGYGVASTRGSGSMIGNQNEVTGFRRYFVY